MADKRAEFIKEVGKAIKTRRERKGLDQAPFAKDAGTSPTTLSAIENGKQATNLALLFDVATELGCQPWELMQPESSQTQLDTGELGDVIGALIAKPERLAAVRALLGLPAQAERKKRG